jgi:predicted GNAT family acetyltransferase
MEVTLNLAKSRFEVDKDGLIAVADFELEPGFIIVTHVVVPPRIRGGGVASTLAAEVVAYARRENVKIVPQCMFMEQYFQRHPEIADLLA